MGIGQGLSLTYVNIIIVLSLLIMYLPITYLSIVYLHTYLYFCNTANLSVIELIGILANMMKSCVSMCVKFKYLHVDQITIATKLGCVKC
jgi:hypothetical protein